MPTLCICYCLVFQGSFPYSFNFSAADAPVHRMAKNKFKNVSILPERREMLIEL
jgi:hypothetical protein